MSENYKEYRDDLADKLRDIRNEDKVKTSEGVKLSSESKAKADGYLEAIKDLPASGYEDARRHTIHERKSDVDLKRKEAIRQKSIDFMDALDIENRSIILFDNDEKFRSLASDFYASNPPKRRKDDYRENESSYYFATMGWEGESYLSQCDKEIDALRGIKRDQDKKDEFLKIMTAVAELEKSQDAPIDHQIEISESIPGNYEYIRLIQTLSPKRESRGMSDFVQTLTGLYKLRDVSDGGKDLLKNVRSELNRRRDEKIEKEVKKANQIKQERIDKQNLENTEKEKIASLDKFDPGI